MGKSFSQGLAVSENMIVRMERRLPLKGEVKVAKGDKVKSGDVVAITMLPGKVVPLNLANLLGTTPNLVFECLRVKEGDKITKDQVLAQTKGLLGMFKATVKSPTDGEIEAISKVTGQAMLREPRIPVQVLGFIDGTVVDIIPDEGVVVENRCAYVQGIFGVGGETNGVLKVTIKSPDDILTPDQITEQYKDLILVSGSMVSYETVQKAIQVGVRGLITGGIDDQDLKRLLGYDLGVAITGHEKLGITVFVTEGFGNIRMARKTFELLRKFDGKQASMHGRTQIRAGVIRPELIIPLEAGGSAASVAAKELPVLEPGKVIRVIRQPNFGIIGKITAMPDELVSVESETLVRVLEAELEDGQKVVIPRANVEIIEE
jgi:hypothetical protein